MKGFSVCPSGGQGSEHQRVSTAPLPSIALRAQGACYAAVGGGGGFGGSMAAPIPTYRAPAAARLRSSCAMNYSSGMPKRIGARRNGDDRRSTSMALPVAMRAVATLTLLLAVVLPTAAQPLRPALKQAQCPVGYMQSGGFCTPMSRNAPPSTEKRGFVLRSPLIPRKAFRLSPYPPL
jgi:hypothetical protein